MMIWRHIFGAAHKIERWNGVQGQTFSNLPVTIFGGHNEIATTKRIGQQSHWTADGARKAASESERHHTWHLL